LRYDTANDLVRLAVEEHGFDTDLLRDQRRPEKQSGFKKRRIIVYGCAKSRSRCEGRGMECRGCFIEASLCSQMKLRPAFPPDADDIEAAHIILPLIIRR